MLHIQLLSPWCYWAAVTIHVCHGSFVLVLSGSLKSDTFTQRKIRADFFSFFRKLTIIHLIPWLICHWNLKQSAFYWECPNFEKIFKLASKTFLLPPPYLSKKVCEYVCGWEGRKVGSGEQLDSFSKMSIILSLRKTTTYSIKAKKNVKIYLIISKE